MLAVFGGDSGKTVMKVFGVATTFERDGISA
jgi:hypothetical protein